MKKSSSASNPKSLSSLALLSLCIAIGMYLGVGITWLTAMLVSPIGRVLGQTLVLSFFAPIPLSLAAIVMGSIAIRQIKKHNLRGRWMAIVGIILGSIGLLFFSFYLVYSINLAKALSVG
jgi:hypothetical protein